VPGNLVLDESFFEAPALTDDRLTLRFAGEGFDVKYLQTMPNATGVNFEGAIIGNRLEVAYKGGKIEAVEIFDGNFILRANGGGLVSSLMEVVNNPPFEIASRYGVEPKDLAGRGTLSIQLTRPLRVDITPEEIDYKINGEFTGVNAPFKLGQYDIENGDVTLDIDREKVTIAGPVDIGSWPVEMSWVETLGQDAVLPQYSVTGVISPEFFDDLGFASRSWFDGEAALTIQAEGYGADLKYAEFDLDLTKSELSFEHIWLKPEGEAALLLAQLRRSSGGGYIIDNSRLTGKGIAVTGRMDLDANFKPDLINLTAIQIDDFINSAVQIIPDREAGRLNIGLDAEFLNVSAWTEDLFAERQSNLDVPISFNGAVEVLVLDRDYVVTQSEFDVTHSGDVFESASLKALSEGKALNLELTTRADKRRQVAVTLPDASKALAAFIGLDNTKGGKLNIIAGLPAAGEEGPIIGTAEMRDFKVREAPALAQLLSLASLTGLADTLTSGSMQFDRFKVPFTVLGDDVSIRDARLYGPALGMTADGEVNLDRRVMDFDGTIVPAYTANSFLADIPLLGGIFAQEKGGGLIALTYTASETR